MWILGLFTVCGAPGLDFNLLKMRILGSFTVCGALGLDSNEL